MKIGFKTDDFNNVICFDLTGIDDEEDRKILINDLLNTVKVEKEDNLNLIVNVKPEVININASADE